MADPNRSGNPRWVPIPGREPEVKGPRTTLKAPPVEAPVSTYPQVVTLLKDRITPLADIEAQAVEQTLEHAKGVVAEAARLLETSRATVLRKEVKRRAQTAAPHRYVVVPPEGIPLEEIKRQAVVEALKMCGWVQTRAAKKLRISREKLRRVVDIYNILPPGGDWRSNAHAEASVRDSMR